MTKPRRAPLHVVDTTDTHHRPRHSTSARVSSQARSRPTSHEPTAHPSEAYANSNPHAHPHQTRPRDTSVGPFAHERLAAYQVALQMATTAGEVAAAIPRGHRNIADHMLRAASNCVLLLAEGANRRGAGEKRQRFVEARGEAGEVAAAVDLATALSLLRSPQLGNLKHLAARVAALGPVDNLQLPGIAS